MTHLREFANGFYDGWPGPTWRQLGEFCGFVALPALLVLALFAVTLAIMVVAQ